MKSYTVLKAVDRGIEHSAHFKAVTALKALYDLVFMGFITAHRIPYTPSICQDRTFSCKMPCFSVFLQNYSAFPLLSSSFSYAIIP
jgi:hypothetical protein